MKNLKRFNENWVNKLIGGEDSKNKNRHLDEIVAILKNNGVGITDWEGEINDSGTAWKVDGTNLMLTFLDGNERAPFGYIKVCPPFVKRHAFNKQGKVEIYSDDLNRTATEVHELIERLKRDI